MKRTILALAIMLSATLSTTGVWAQARPSTQSLLCGQAQALVLSRGAIVLNTGRSTYDRFVASRQFCMIGEVLEPVWAPTRDVPQCLVGYRCLQGDGDDLFFRRW